MKTKIKEILAVKGHSIWAVSPESTVFEAIEVMADKGVGALAVTLDEKLVGIVSERDYARKVILKGQSSRETFVREIMSTEVVCVSGEEKVDECMALMTEKRIRHLPILDGDKLVGMISVGDLVKTIIRDQTFTIEQLEGYIRGR
ncbi:MAG: CBS domain-containing protein [Gammaproteobacteria bacterium]|nr:CBS domain-containing protein [Gammaproteobacteria bacterium]